MSWLFFAIAAPALYGISNFIDKLLIEKYIQDVVVLMSTAAGLTFLFGFAIFALSGFPIFPWQQTALIIISGGLMEFALVPYFRAMADDDTSRVVPLFQVIPLFILVISYVFLGERLSGGQLTGFFFILIGGFLLSLQELNLKVFSLRPSFYWMMLASSMYAIATVIFKFVVTQSNFWGTLGYEFMGGELAVLFLFLIPQYRRRIFAQMKSTSAKLFGIFALNEAVYTLGRMVGFYAFALAAVSLVSVMGGFQPLFALLYGIVLSLWFPHIIEEDIRGATIGLKVVSIVLIFAGLWFINV